MRRSSAQREHLKPTAPQKPTARVGIKLQVLASSIGVHFNTGSHCRRRRRGSVYGIMLGTLFLVVSIAILLWSTINPSKQHSLESPSAVTYSRANFPVTIRKPSGPPTVDTGLTDAEGNAVTVSCGTCHATRQPNLENRTVTDLNEFHSNLAFSHGTVSCLSCHNSRDYDALQLADTTRVEFTEVMTLCAQCHGPQMRDYEHGAHGGMNGYWDLTRGSREKNNCVDCHNPHAPQFPTMQPTFKPRDRFLEKKD